MVDGDNCGPCIYSFALAMMTDEDGAGADRGRVSIVVPFFGDASSAAELAAAMARLRVRAGDELIVADNTPDGTFAAAGPFPDIRVVPAQAERSSYHARNAGAATAGGEWLYFFDADCRPPPDIVDRYLANPVPAEVAIVAGPIVPADGQAGLMAEWAATRGILDQHHGLTLRTPGAATANLMVRRRAWAAAGGFLEGVRSGADHEFCWRVQDSGGLLEYRPAATVEHVHRTTLGATVRQLARYSAGNAWQRRRRPGSVPAPHAPRHLLRALAGSAFFAVTLRPRRAALKAIDGVAAVAQAIGRHLGNAVAPPLEPGSNRILIATDRFPTSSETFITGEIAALRSLGRDVRVEAVARPATPAVGAAWHLDVRYLEDETVPGRARALAWTVARHPVQAFRDVRLRRAFDRAEVMPLSAIAPSARRLARGRERHVHVHFAALAAVNAIRAGRFTGARVSVAPHGHEVFATPRALPAKLAQAAFVAAPCEYTARHLRPLAGSETRIEVVVMGVDGERFGRQAPYPGGATIAAVGRLVEKKGFSVLVDAAARLDADRFDRLLIVGDGPLRADLEDQIGRLGLGSRIQLLGGRDPEGVRAVLEEADLVAVPCVVAPDGDRDAMPVVAKEALAMEVPVVASDEVGLPEVVREGWGRLVAPNDAAALARGLAELLALPPRERAAMGAAGREFVLANFDQVSQAERLLALIDGDTDGG